jgi:pimeloyl-ACP methyl ester carboxylesterase
MVFGVDARTELRSLQVPVLYLQATRDVVVPANCLRVIQQVHPNVRVARFDSSHLVFQTRGKETAAVVAEFAEACTTAMT